MRSLRRTGILLLIAAALLAGSAAGNKKIEFAASLTNILNKRSYNYTTYSQLSSFESQRQLRGRQLLFSITLRK